MDYAIQTFGLTKVFADLWGRAKVRAVTDLNLQVLYNEVFGLLGPNGSGKTTTLKMLLGLLHPTRGRAVVLGGDSTDPKISARLGFMPEESYLYRYLTARETLDFYGRLFGLPGRVRRRRIEALLDMVGLNAVGNRPVGTFSKGMARRIGLAQALINDPELLILDEPTTGLDPNQIIEIRSLIKELGKEKTVILSTHILPEVEATCGRVMIIHQGKLIAQGSLDEVIKLASGANIHRVRIKGERSAIESKLGEIDGVDSVQFQGEDDGFYRYQILAQPGRDLGEEIFRVCVQNQFILSELYRERRTLEDVFTQLTGGERE